MSSKSKSLRGFVASCEIIMPHAKPTLTPKLRFPEFRGAEGWEERNLGSICQMQAGKFVAAADIHERSAQGFYPCYGGNGLRGYTKTFTHSGKFPLIGRQGALCGNVRLGLGQFHATEHAVVTTPESGVDVDWLFYVFGFLNLNRFATGQAQPGLSVDVIAKIPVSKPVDETEQQKIAACLTTLDEVIAAQTQKLNALKTHKKGLMQQLFPREGETQPRLRFPEFQGSGEWMVEPLGQLAGYENGKAYEKDITENGKYVVVNSRFISTDGAVRKYTNAEYLTANAGEVLMVLSDLPKGRALAKVYFVEANDRYAVNQRVCRLRPKGIDGKFFYYVLNRHPRLLAYDDGLNQTHLSKGGVTDCPLCVPRDKAEQHRIATCLTTLDDLITAQSAKLSALKTHKKGLMQQLFPSPGEEA